MFVINKDVSKVLMKRVKTLVPEKFDEMFKEK